MTRPMTQVMQMTYHNPHASAPLYVPVAVVCNTADETLAENVRVNAARDLPWIAVRKPHAETAVMCGGGASIEDHLEDIRKLQNQGAAVFAMNGASTYLRRRGIAVDYQVIADAKVETAQLVDLEATERLFASQAHPDTVKHATRLWHLEIGNIEEHFPPEKRAAGGYALIGGGAAVGNSALCLAYATGFRDFHVFGYDSCHRDGQSHAYDQPMNRFMPCVDVTWGGERYVASLAMKAQAEKFQITAQALKQNGCAIEVYGDGLLQAMYRTPATHLAERDKYRLMWQFDGYRAFSPGETAVARFSALTKPDSVIDFGCGTGRAGLRLADEGYSVVLVDFADNCRDEEALSLPFLEWDLTLPCPLRAPYGLCTDVMEHIPTADVDRVVGNIMASASAVFFQISTVKDVFGDVIGERLHNTVQPHAWWAKKFASLGFEVSWQEENGHNSCFFVTSNQTEK